MTTTWPNGFAGGVDWRSWSDGLWQTASAGGLGTDASGEPEATDAVAPAVVITNASPAILVSYTPPNGVASNPSDEMDLAAYFSLIGYDPAAIEEMNANGSYRSEHDIYQANGGLQSQAEEAWRRSGMWARGDGWNDLNRELFFNNYMDRAYGIDPEAGTSLNDPRLAKLAAEALNKASKDGDQQGVEALRILLKQSGFDVRLVFVGEHFDPNLSDDIDAYHQKMKFVVTPTGSSGPYQTGGMDGFQDVGNFRIPYVPSKNEVASAMDAAREELSQSIDNAIVGKAAELVARPFLEAIGAQVINSQVRFWITDDQGVRGLRIYDYAAFDKNGDLTLVEVKANGADRSARQLSLDTALVRNGATVGTRKMAQDGYVIGQHIPNIRVVVIQIGMT
jgi:hypothetical protein